MNAPPDYQDPWAVATIVSADVHFVNEDENRQIRIPLREDRTY
jgi:hypothetical protein